MVAGMQIRPAIKASRTTEARKQRSQLPGRPQLYVSRLNCVCLAHRWLVRADERSHFLQATMSR